MNLEEKLKEYEDFELAFLLTYKTSDYLDSSQKKIVSELKRRGIVSEEQIDLRTSIDKIVEDFEQNAEEAISHYSNKIILLQGSYRSLTTSESGIKNLVLEGEYQLANCELDLQSNTESTALHTGDVLEVKGLFVGYDDLLGELQLKKCIIIK